MQRHHPIHLRLLPLVHLAPEKIAVACIMRYPLVIIQHTDNDAQRVTAHRSSAGTAAVTRFRCATSCGM